VHQVNPSRELRFPWRAAREASGHQAAPLEGATLHGLEEGREIIGEFKLAMTKASYLALARGLFKKERYASAA
jgi:hypothetical protein